MIAGPNGLTQMFVVAPEIGRQVGPSPGRKLATSQTRPPGLPVTSRPNMPGEVLCPWVPMVMATRDVP